MDPVHESSAWTWSKVGVHGPLVHVFSSPVWTEGQFFANDSIHKTLLFEQFLKAHSWLPVSNCAQISHCVALSWGRDLIIMLNFYIRSPAHLQVLTGILVAVLLLRCFVMTGFHCYLCFYSHQSKYQKLSSKWL